MLLCGFFAGWRFGGVGLSVKAAGLRAEPYRLMRSATDPYELTPAKWLFEPHRYGDFDLKATIELGENTTMDLLVRQVEPRLVDDVLQPFDGRFAVLRISTAAAGPAWLDRESALLGDLHAGQKLAPGMSATLWLQARGRTLRANVAGQWLPPFEADDRYGMQTMLVRGGKAVLRNFVIEPMPQDRAWLHARWFWAAVGAAVGAGLAGLGAAMRAKLGTVAYAGLAAAVIAQFASGRLGPLPLAMLEPRGILEILLGLGLAAAFLVVPARRRLLAALVTFGVCVVGGGWLVATGAARIERPRIAAPDRVDELVGIFGTQVGNAYAEALAQRVRGDLFVHCVGQAERNVMLLGGRLLYGSRTAAEPDALEPHLMTALVTATGRKYDAPTLPTPDGHAAQQWRLFERFYQGYRPEAIVFGVPLDEDAPDAVAGAPRSSPEALAATIERAKAYAERNGCGLVLFTIEGLPAPLLAVLERMSSADVPLVVVAAQATQSQTAEQLAAALAGRLKR
jgi:hypothetical protein